MGEEGFRIPVGSPKLKQGGRRWLKRKKKKQSKITPSGKVTALIKYLSCSSLRLH